MTKNNMDTEESSNLEERLEVIEKNIRFLNAMFSGHDSFNNYNPLPENIRESVTYIKSLKLWVIEQIKEDENPSQQT